MKFLFSKTNKLLAFLAWIALPALWVSVSSLRAVNGAPGSEGQETFKAKCAACHAPDGSGNTTLGKKLKLRDLRSPEVQKQSDDQLFNIIAKGKSPMPGYDKQLVEAKIRELVAYIRGLCKKH